MNLTRIKVNQEFSPRGAPSGDGLDLQQPDERRLVFLVE
jgi:hypothetical protein